MLCSASLAQVNSAQNPPQLEVIVSRVERAQAQAHPQAAYQQVRKYRIFPSSNTQAVSASEVVAQVDFRLPHTKNYAIQKRTGSSRAEEVVRHILDHEVQASAEGREVPSSAVMEGNYEFTYLGESELENRPCYLLGLTPKRKDKNLVIGRAWVDKQSFLIRQIDGDLIKSPSWWIKKVHVRLDFGEVGGMWLQTATQASADVRVFGSQTLTSEILDHRSSDTVATRLQYSTRTRR